MGGDCLEARSFTLLHCRNRLASNTTGEVDNKASPVNLFQEPVGGVSG
jgi:hypothetical protein